MRRLSLKGLSETIVLPLVVWMRGKLAPLVAVLALALAFFGNGILATGKTYIVDAAVAGATIEFSGHQNDWYVGDTFVCVPKEKRSRQRGEAKDDLPCDTRLYDVASKRDFVLEWPQGTAVRVRIGELGRLEFLVLSGSEGLKKNTLFVLPADYFTTNGALSFSGSVVFGRPIETGARDILLHGTYRVREDHFLASLLGKGTYEIALAELTRGDQVRVVDAASQTTASTGFGHLSLSSDIEAAVRLVFHSTPGNHALEISTFGMSEPAVVRPNWIDSTLASPFVLIVGLFISLSISILELHALTRKE
ncbi:hypothetical protein CSC82_03765 [Rhodobacteraceae bacterium 4F10]|nr:hypothetical protein CSC82_03765 [Rhodobacteraceae bacterium 4F10]